MESVPVGPEISEMPPTVEADRWQCLVCDARLTARTSLNVFYTSLPKTGELLASFVLRVLRHSEGDLRGSQICPSCYDLFKNLEQAQWTATRVKREILRVYARRNSSGIDFNVCGKTTEAQDSLEADGKQFFQAPFDDTETSRENSVEKVAGGIADFAANLDIGKFNVAAGQETELNDPRNTSVDYDTVADYHPSEIETIEKSIESQGREGIPVTSRNESAERFNDHDETSTDPRSDYVDETETESSAEKREFGCRRSGRISKYSGKALKYTCETCDKKWRTAAELKTHVKSHSSLRPYMCEKCGRAYKHKHALEIHIGMHNGVSPFKCNVCDKCFTQKGALVRHLPMHTGETPYQCELCGKRYVHHTSYNMHALSHTGTKSYQCPVCDLCLLSTSHLKRHMRVHTGEKPYGCSLCGKSFAERYNLIAHQKIHDPAEIMARAAKQLAFKCERCDEYFGEKKKLDEHAITHETMKQDFCNNFTIDVGAEKNDESSRTSDHPPSEETRRQILCDNKLTNFGPDPRSQQFDNRIAQDSINFIIAPGNYETMKI